MTIDEIHKMAIIINDNWEDWKSTKRQYVNEEDFFKMIENAYLLARAGDYN